MEEKMEIDTIEDLLTDLVLEKGISKMIIDDKKDMEQIELDTIFIRQINYCEYSIFKKDNVDIKWNFNTENNFNTDKLKTNKEQLLMFFKQFLMSFKSINSINIITDEELRTFILTFVKEMILYFYKMDKDNLICFFDENTIEEYILLGINDKIEDIIYESQFNIEIQNKYKDYMFNYENHLVFEEANDNIDLLDIDMLDYQAFRRDNTQERDYMFMDDNTLHEIERFKSYLSKKGELFNIEIEAISFYLDYIVYDTDIQYREMINYIFNE